MPVSLTVRHNAFGDSYPGIPFEQQLVAALTPGIFLSRDCCFCRLFAGPLYDVYAEDAPPFTSNQDLVYIGTLEITGPPTTSHYGDR
jgi:hypothetical protein